MPLPEPPVALSAVSLRLAGEVGHAVLARIAAGDLASAAELDQHVAAVRAVLMTRRTTLASSAHVASIAGLADGRIGMATRAVVAEAAAQEASEDATGPAAADDGDAGSAVATAPGPADEGPATASPAAPGTATSPSAGGATARTDTSEAAAAPVTSNDFADMDSAPARWRGPAGSRRQARRDDMTCPDVPFTSTAWRGESIVPLRLLLHYACGFVEGAVTSDWWPGQYENEDEDEVDYESMRLAAVCHLISQTETAAELPSELR